MGKATGPSKAGPTSTARLKLLMAVALVLVIGFQVVTHIHWFRIHGLTSVEAVPCPDPEVPVSVQKRDVVVVAVKEDEAIVGSDVMAANMARGILLPLPGGEEEQHGGEKTGVPDGGCGDGEIDLFVAVLGAPTERSRKGRKTARETWMSLPLTGTARVVVRFVLARDKDGKIPADLALEAGQHGDLIFVDTLDAYKNLAMKVGLTFKWVVDSCKGNPIVLKTDEDSFIDLTKLTAALTEVPKERLYWGRFLRGIPARKNGRALPGNHQNMHVWPDYASGAGYAMSFDVAKAVGYPIVELQWHEAEDQHVGIALFGYNITQLEDPRFSPWGDCHDDTFLLHYQRHPEILRRRMRRVLAGQSMCGVPFKQHTEVCNKAEPNKEATWACPDGKTMTSVIGATYGRVYSSGSSGSCAEGAEGLEPLLWCHAPNSKEIVETACLGKTKCTLKADHKQFGADPCKGERKHLVAAMTCG
jgi:hypothetical protein